MGSDHSGTFRQLQRADCASFDWYTHTVLPEWNDRQETENDVAPGAREVDAVDPFVDDGEDGSDAVTKDTPQQTHDVIAASSSGSDPFEGVYISSVAILLS